MNQVRKVFSLFTQVYKLSLKKDKGKQSQVSNPESFYSFHTRSCSWASKLSPHKNLSNEFAWNFWVSSVAVATKMAKTVILSQVLDARSSGLVISHTSEWKRHYPNPGCVTSVSLSKITYSGSATMLILKTHICSSTTDLLGNILSMLNFKFHVCFCRSWKELHRRAQ